MSLTSIVVLTGILVAFGIFATVLAWGDYQSRQRPRASSVKPVLLSPTLNCDKNENRVRESESLDVV